MNTDSSYPKWLYCLGLIPTIWLALLIAPSVNGGLPQIMKDFSDVIGNPFHITWCDSSIKVIIIFIILLKRITVGEKNTALQGGEMQMR